MLFKQAERVRIGDHQPHHVLAARGAERFQIDVTARVRGQFHHFEAAHCGAGRIRAVRRIRDENLLAHRVAAIQVISAHHQNAGELAVRARRRLQTNRRKPADLFQPFLQLIHQRQIALHRFGGLQRVRVGKTWQPRRILVDARVVFHGATAQRVKAAINRVIQNRKVVVVAHHVQLRHFGQIQRLDLAHESGRQVGQRHIRLRQAHAFAAGRRKFVNERFGHYSSSPNASTKASMSSGSSISVTHTSM